MGKRKFLQGLRERDGKSVMNKWRDNKDSIGKSERKKCSVLKENENISYNINI